MWEPRGFRQTSGPVSSRVKSKRGRKKMQIKNRDVSLVFLEITGDLFSYLLIFCWGLGLPKSVPGVRQASFPWPHHQIHRGGIFLGLFVFCPQIDFSNKRKGQREQSISAQPAPRTLGNFPNQQHKNEMKGTFVKNQERPPGSCLKMPSASRCSL